MAIAEKSTEYEKKHIGMYPPVKGDEQLRQELERYRGEKDNLKFPLDEPIPYDLIGRIAKCRREQQEVAAAKWGKMKLLRTKIWSWYDIGLLKWSVLLFGMVAGAYFHEFVEQHVWTILAAAVLLVIRPVIVYYRD